MASIRIALERSPTQILRALVHEIKKGNANVSADSLLALNLPSTSIMTELFTLKKAKISNNDLVKFLMNESRHLQTTDERTCQARNERLFLAESYLTYLQSGRQYRDISAQYGGKGERSVQETAGLVGFKLPHDPK